ncbi:unnamed protein product [Choristocarpus tenellus]
MGLLGDLREKHEVLKARIHAFRIPLSPRGQLVMSIVYFSIPVVGGYYLMQWAQSRAHVNLREAKIVPENSGSDIGRRVDSMAKAQNEALMKQLRYIEKKG